mmetsp:Transcript_6044/g.16918  ORF Transcript_6044/g.16918 Transcript_6044/m.16918 type:complete len:263 (-) Transcript_6044:168-956(-)
MLPPIALANGRQGAQVSHGEHEQRLRRLHGSVHGLQHPRRSILGNRCLGLGEHRRRRRFRDPLEHAIAVLVRDRTGFTKLDELGLEPGAHRHAVQVREVPPDVIDVDVAGGLIGFVQRHDDGKADLKEARHDAVQVLRRPRWDLGHDHGVVEIDAGEAEGPAHDFPLRAVAAEERHEAVLGPRGALLPHAGGVGHLRVHLLRALDDRVELAADVVVDPAVELLTHPRDLARGVVALGGVALVVRLPARVHDVDEHVGVAQVI